MKHPFANLLQLIPILGKNHSYFNARPIELFRIAFGIIVILQMLWFIKVDFVYEDIIKPIIHFPFFSFLKPLPDFIMHSIIYLNIIAGVGIILGRYLKIVLGFFLLSFTYLWLLDKGYYNNHYYLTSLIAFLLLLIPGLGENGWKIKRENITHSLPRWCFQILKFQWFIVFFIAGVNKLNKYWLFQFQPMKFVFDFKAKFSGNQFWAQEWLAPLFSYGGLFFDLGIGFLLLFKKTRLIAFLLLVGFNSFNGIFFSDIGEIGIFPFFVLTAILVFLETEETTSKQQLKIKPSKLTHYLLYAWVIFQFVFPFRHLLYKGYVDWTGEQQRFAWRMKIAQKEVDMQFYVNEKGNQQKHPINIEKTLTPKQYNNLGYCPDFLPVLGEFLAQEAEKQGIRKPIVTADFKVSLNGNAKQYIINNKQALNQLSYANSKHNKWIKLAKKNIKNN